MTIISQPDVTINIIAATDDIANDPQRVLFVGQKIAGTATAGALVENVGNSGEEDALFGATSILAQAVRQARIINKETRFDVISLDDAGGAVSASSTLIFTGTATADGTYIVSVGSKTNYPVTIPVVSGDTAAVVAGKVDTAIGLFTNAPFTSGVVTTTVTFTATNGGTVGNKYGVQVEGVVAGLTFAITAFASGATDPTLTGLFDVIDGQRYQTIAYPSNYDLTVLTAELDPRFNTSNDVLDGVGVVNVTDTLANVLIAGNAENSSSLTMYGSKLRDDDAHKGAAMLEFDDVKTAKFSALRSLRRTDGADISQYVISTNGSLDSFGGISIASLPYFNSPITGLPLIDTGKGWSSTEITQLEAAGVSVMGNNRTNTAVLLGEALTTRKTDAAGNVEKTFKFLNNVDTSSAIREYYFDNLRARFAQSRLTDGDLQPNRNNANKSIIETYLDELFVDMGNASLAQSGDAALAFFKANRKVTLDLTDGSVTVTMTMPIVVQLRTIIATMQIAFSTGSN